MMRTACRAQSAARLSEFLRAGIADNLRQIATMQVEIASAKGSRRGEYSITARQLADHV